MTRFRSLSVPGVAAFAVLIGSVACATGDPTDTPGVRTFGDETVIYDGPELSATLTTREARRMLGAEHLVLEVQLGGRSTSGVLYLDRSAISLQTPDRRLLPMMTQPEFLDDYGQLASAAMRVEFQSQGPPDTRVMETPCVDWYFRRPTDGLAVDHLTITPFKPCWGPLFFHVPGGVQPGRWELHIRLEESKAEIPFIVERD